jgi:undecaprenyl-phosphate galactose phosphotransferase
MSVLMTAPERQSFPYEESRSRQQQFDPRHRLRQICCLLFLLLADLSTIAVGLKLAIFLRLHLSVHTVSNMPLWTFPFRYYLAFWWLWLLPLLFLAVEGLYTQRRSLWSEIGYLTKAICMSLAAVLAAVALTQQVVSRGTVLLTGVNLLILLPIARFWTKQFLGAAGLWRKRILVLGASGTGSLAIRGLTSDPVLGYEVVGVLDDDPAKRGRRVGAYGGQPIFILGNLSEARQVMEQTQTRDVLIAMPSLPEAKLLALVQEFQPYCGSIYVVPQMWGLPMMNLQVEGFLRERVMMLKLSNNLAKPWNTCLKRGADLLLGAVATVFVLPICLILAALIKIDSEGPAVLFQERLGYRGRHFRCLKFRTMYINNEKKLEQYIASNSEAAAEWLKYAKLRNYDPRVTRLGRFLRKWSLDELPQLLNVLKGEMSLVGPRPYLPQERDRIGVELPTILSARPGITGFWQVSGRNQLTFDERVQVEAWYIRNWSIWLDCIVLIKTIRIVLFPESKTDGGDNPASDGTIHAFPNFPSAAPGFAVNQREGLCESD